VPLATYKQRLPDTTYSPTSYTTILFYQYPPGYYVTTIAAGYEGLKALIQAGKAMAKRGSPPTCPEIWVQGWINYNMIALCVVCYSWVRCR